MPVVINRDASFSSFVRVSPLDGNPMASLCSPNLVTS